MVVVRGLCACAVMTLAALACSGPTETSPPGSTTAGAGAPTVTDSSSPPTVLVEDDLHESQAMGFPTSAEVSLSEIEAARDRWSTERPDHYRWRYTIRCFGCGDGFAEVEVEGSAVIGLDGDVSDDGGAANERWSVDDVFEMMAADDESGSEDCARLRQFAAFDEVYGFPTEWAKTHGDPSPSAEPGCGILPDTQWALISTELVQLP